MQYSKEELVVNTRHIQNFYHVDFLKGLCILFVVITHSSWSNMQRLNYLFPFWINMAVPIFMIVSGYLYAHSYSSKEIYNLEQAYRMADIIRRCIRYIVPIFLIIMIEYLIFGSDTKLY